MAVVIRLLKICLLIIKPIAIMPITGTINVVIVEQKNLLNGWNIPGINANMVFRG
jgi:hypothetical protein